MDQQDETRLVELARNQDADAFAKLYSTVYKDLYRFAFYVLGNPEDAEDLVMETVADAFSISANYAPPLRSVHGFFGF